MHQYAEAGARPAPRCAADATRVAGHGLLLRRVRRSAVRHRPVRPLP